MAASAFHGPLDVDKWGVVAVGVLMAIKRVDAAMNLDHRSMTSFEARLTGGNLATRMDAKRGNIEGERQRNELLAQGRKVLQRTASLGQQVGGN